MLVKCERFLSGPGFLRIVRLIWLVLAAGMLLLFWIGQASAFSLEDAGWPVAAACWIWLLFAVLNVLLFLLLLWRQLRSHFDAMNSACLLVLLSTFVTQLLHMKQALVLQDIVRGIWDFSKAEYALAADISAFVPWMYGIAVLELLCGLLVRNTK